MQSKRAIIYLRVSTPHQKDDGIEKQRNICLLELKRRDITKKLIFIDIVSGAAEVIERPALTKAINALKRGDVFIVANRARLARAPKIAVDINSLLKKTNTPLIVVDEQKHSSHCDILESSVEDLFAEHERKIVKARTKAVAAAFKEQRKRFGNIPFGFHLAPDGKHTELCPKEQKYIAYAQYLNELGLEVSEIIKKMTDKKFVGRTEKPFASNQVKRMINMSVALPYEENPPPMERTKGTSQDNAMPLKKEMRDLVISLRLQGCSIPYIAKVIKEKGFVTKKGKPIRNNQFARILKKAGITGQGDQGVPFGFKKLPTGFLEKNEEEQEIIMQVHALRKQKYSYNDITQHINHHGYRSRNRTPFLKNQIVRILDKEIS